MYGAKTEHFIANNCYLFTIPLLSSSGAQFLKNKTSQISFPYKVMLKFVKKDQFSL